MKDTPILFDIAKVLNSEFSIKLDIELVATADVMTRIQSSDYDLIYLYTGVSALEPIVELTYIFKHPLSKFHKHLKDLKMEIDQCKTEPDRNKYINLVRGIHRTLLTESFIIPTIHTSVVYLTNGSYRPKDFNHFDGGINIWEWQLE